MTTEIVSHAPKEDIYSPAKPLSTSSKPEIDPHEIFYKAHIDHPDGISETFYIQHISEEHIENGNLSITHIWIDGHCAEEVVRAIPEFSHANKIKLWRGLEGERQTRITFETIKPICIVHVKDESLVKKTHRLIRSFFQILLIFI